MTHEDVKRRAQEDGIEFFLAQFVDMNGKPSAKLMPIQAIDELLGEGAGFAGFAAGPIGQTPASPDMLAVPDVARTRTFRGRTASRASPVTSRSRASRGRTARARSCGTPSNEPRSSATA